LAPVALVAALASAATGFLAPLQPPPARNPVPIMGSSALTASQLYGWYAASKSPDSPAPGMSVDVRTLADYYLWEGARERVRGDIAFAQAIVETGWFRFSRTVRPGDNNFAGLGACDTCTSGLRFGNAQTGVRAQIQHLRAYADASATRCAR